MTQSTTQITAKRFFRQDTKPNSAPDGATWVTESDGSGDDTTGRYQYNVTTDTWELNSAVGPSEPNAGTMVAGATWRDTAEGAAKQYDGVDFRSLAPKTASYADQIDIAATKTEEVLDNATMQPPEGDYYAKSIDFSLSRLFSNNTESGTIEVKKPDGTIIHTYDYVDDGSGDSTSVTLSELTFAANMPTVTNLSDGGDDVEIIYEVSGYASHPLKGLI